VDLDLTADDDGVDGGVDGGGGGGSGTGGADARDSSLPVVVDDTDGTDGEAEEALQARRLPPRKRARRDSQPDTPPEAQGLVYFSESEEAQWVQVAAEAAAVGDQQAAALVESALFVQDEDEHEDEEGDEAEEQDDPAPAPSPVGVSADDVVSPGEGVSDSVLRADGLRDRLHALSRPPPRRSLGGSLESALTSASAPAAL
jgi:hypothetical protein